MVTVADILDAFELLDDWEERYGYIIDLGKKLPPLTEEYKTEEYRVQGCVSNVWLVPRINDAEPDKLFFDADSDAHIVRGLIAIILAAYSGKTPAEVLAVDLEGLFERLELRSHLSPSRSNGFFSMAQRIRALAQAAA